MVQPNGSANQRSRYFLSLRLEMVGVFGPLTLSAKEKELIISNINDYGIMTFFLLNSHYKLNTLKMNYSDLCNNFRRSRCDPGIYK